MQLTSCHFTSSWFVVSCHLPSCLVTIFFHALSCLSQSHLSSFDVISSSSESTCSLVVFHACSSHVKAPDLSSDFFLHLLFNLFPVPTRHRSSFSMRTARKVQSRRKRGPQRRTQSGGSLRGSQRRTQSLFCRAKPCVNGTQLDLADASCGLSYMALRLANAGSLIRGCLGIER